MKQGTCTLMNTGGSDSFASSSTMEGGRSSRPGHPAVHQKAFHVQMQESMWPLTSVLTWSGIRESHSPCQVTFKSHWLKGSSSYHLLYFAAWLSLFYFEAHLDSLCPSAGEVSASWNDWCLNETSSVHTLEQGPGYKYKELFVLFSSYWISRDKATKGRVWAPWIFCCFFNWATRGDMGFSNLAVFRQGLASYLWEGLWTQPEPRRKASSCFLRVPSTCAVCCLILEIKIK